MFPSRLQKPRLHIGRRCSFKATPSHSTTRPEHGDSHQMTSAVRRQAQQLRASQLWQQLSRQPELFPAASAGDI